MRRWRILLQSFAILSLWDRAAADAGRARPAAEDDPLSQSPIARTNSDLAFWEELCVQGYYDGSLTFGDSGFRIFDISDPARP
jgi:hypothetical protein